MAWDTSYFTRLWCCYELAAFYRVRESEKQKVVFVPAALPRVLFANALGIWLSCLPDSIMPLIGPAVGIDPTHVVCPSVAWGLFCGFPRDALPRLSKGWRTALVKMACSPVAGGCPAFVWR